MVSFFDFIVAANGRALKDVDGTFIELIKEHEDKPLPLTLYNIKNHSTRDITLTPSRNWPGEGMLGVTIRFDSFYKAEVVICLHWEYHKFLFTKIIFITLLTHFSGKSTSCSGDRAQFTCGIGRVGWTKGFFTGNSRESLQKCRHTLRGVAAEHWESCGVLCL